MGILRGSLELKVDAAESKHQLGKYYQQVETEYPNKDWDLAFVFLTLDGTAPSEANFENWIPISLVEVVQRFDQEVQARRHSGEAVDLFRKYSNMIIKYSF